MNWFVCFALANQLLLHFQKLNLQGLCLLLQQLDFTLKLLIIRST